MTATQARAPRKAVSILITSTQLNIYRNIRDETELRNIDTSKSADEIQS